MTGGINRCPPPSGYAPAYAWFPQRFRNTLRVRRFCESVNTDGYRVYWSLVTRHRETKSRPAERFDRRAGVMQEFTTLPHPRQPVLRPSIACDSNQLDPLCDMQTYQSSIL